MSEHRGSARGAILPVGAMLAARSSFEPVLCFCNMIFSHLHLALPGFLLAQGDFLSEVVKELPSLHPARGRKNEGRQWLSCNSKLASSPWGGSPRGRRPLTARGTRCTKSQADLFIKRGKNVSILLQNIRQEEERLCPERAGFGWDRDRALPVPSPSADVHRAAPASGVMASCTPWSRWAYK